MFFFFFIFGFLYSLAQEDSLPPLPNPYDLELKLTLPEEKLKLTDTAEFILLGGITHSSSDLNFGKPFNSKLVIPIRWRNKFLLLYGNYLIDTDYELYRLFATQISFYFPIRTAFFKNSLSLERKDRLLAYFERMIISHWSVHPFFFGELNPKFDFHFSRFSRYRSYLLYKLWGQNDYIIPTIIGNLGFTSAFLIQSKTYPIGLVGLFDHIILKELTFLKPKISYWFGAKSSNFLRTTDSPNITFGVEFGTQIKKILTLFQFACNERQLFDFDSIYTDVGPLLVKQSLCYPISQLMIKISILTANHELSLCARFDKDQVHWVQSDSGGRLLYYPANSGQKSAYFNWQLKNSISGFLSANFSGQNRLILELNPGGLSLVPVLTFSDCLTLIFKKFGFMLSGQLIGTRECGGCKLNPVFRLDTDLFYSHSFFQVKGGCRNVLKTDWEVYPNYKDKSRKIFVELSIYKTI